MKTVTEKNFVAHQWERIHDIPNVESRHEESQKLNKATKENPVFVSACKKAGINITTRQASKYRRNMGAAYNVEHNVSMTGYIYPEGE